MCHKYFWIYTKKMLQVPFRQLEMGYHREIKFGPRVWYILYIFLTKGIAHGIMRWIKDKGIRSRENQEKVRKFEVFVGTQVPKS